jgi:hypothetical protein
MSSLRYRRTLLSQTPQGRLRGTLCLGLKRQWIDAITREVRCPQSDVTEMAWMLDRLGLTPKQREPVRSNTLVEWLNDVAGSSRR